MTKINKMIDLPVLYFIVLGLFCRYTEHYSIWKLGALAVISIMMMNKSFRKGFIKSYANLAFIFVCVILLLSSLLANDNTYLLGNLLYIVWPLIFIGFFVALSYSHQNLMEKCFRKLYIPLNFIYVINLIAIAIQCSGRPFLIKEAWLAYNSFYEDLCCGLFGLNGTHEFTTFALFMNVYNLSHIKTKRNKLMAYIYIGVLDLVLLYLSTRNDNVAMFVLLPVFIAIFYLVGLQVGTIKIKKILVKIMKLFIPFIVLLLLASNIPFVKHYLDEYVWIRLDMALNFNRSYYQVAGSNERFAIVFNALLSGRGWFWGEGFGSADLGGGSFFGYGSFGLSSIGSFVMLGGIWLYLIYTLQIAKMLQYFVEKRFCLTQAGVIIFGITVFYSSYTILYTSFVSTIWYALIFFQLGLVRRPAKKNVSNTT